MSTTETPTAEPGTGVAEFHRQLATELFSHVLGLLERTDRECSENDRMIHMAHASCFHFQLGGTALNIALGEWQCARVHIALGQSDSALYHAWRYLEHAENYGLGPFHIAQAHAVLSAAFARTNKEEAAHHLGLAKETERARESTRKRRGISRWRSASRRPSRRAWRAAERRS